jgi:hypothetical protein
VARENVVAGDGFAPTRSKTAYRGKNRVRWALASLMLMKLRHVFCRYHCYADLAAV